MQRNSKNRHENRVSNFKQKDIQKMIEIYVHQEETRDPRILDVDENATIKDLMSDVGLKHDSNVEYFVGHQDGENTMDSEATLQELGVGHRHHIHCHRCKRIHVFVMYNGDTIDRQFAPSIRLQKILHWATRQFGLEGQDAADMALFLSGDAEVLDEDMHVGSLASFPECSVHFALNAPLLVNG